MTTATVATDLDMLLTQIAEGLQLPPTVDSEVHAHYDALTKYLANGNLAPLQPELYAQGSYRLNTVVKPLTRDEFDLDFVVELKVPNSRDPATVFNLVASEVERNQHYAGKVVRKRRCIRVSYSKDFHLDIVPTIPDPYRGGTFLLMPCRGTDGVKWERTNPKGYVSWFSALAERSVAEKRAAIDPLPLQRPAAEKSDLQVAVQLLKRNHHVCVSDEGLRTPSIVLTTMAAQASTGCASVQECVTSAIGAMLAQSTSPAPIPNPVNPGEVLNDKWRNEAAFAAFRRHAESLDSQWRALISSLGSGYATVLDLLKEMFGEPAVQRAARAIGENMGRLSQEGRLRTLSAGMLTISPAGKGNPPKTFYGNG
jgi:hypothetical protein